MTDPIAWLDFAPETLQRGRTADRPVVLLLTVPWCQHSPMFGQWASSHTVLSFSSRMMPLSRR